MKKLTVSIIAILVLVLTVLSPVSAAQPDGLQWTNTNVITGSIAYGEGRGYAEGAVIAKFGTSKIQVDAVVYKETNSGWVYVNEEHVTKYERTAAISCQFDADLWGYYRVDFTFTVTKDGYDEIINRTDYELYDTSWD